MKNLVLLLFVILSVPVTAQNIFSPGYIVGDTLRGLILEKSDAEMSRRIVFKSSEEADIQKHSTRTLSAFGFDSGRQFERMAILPKPGKGEDTTFVFAKNMLRGQTDVFVGRPIQKRHPEIFFRNNSSNFSTQIYRSRDAQALEMEEFLSLYYNKPDSLLHPLAVRLQEKKLLRKIAEYNILHSAYFPDSLYREKIANDWIFLAGIPIDYRKEAIHFRGAVYFSRTNTERTPNFSSIHGIIYHHWERKDIEILETQQYVGMNTKWQMLNFIPIAIKFQGSSGNFKPYGYIGAGMAVVREKNIYTEDVTNKRDQVSWRFLPTFNSGIGIQTRLGKNFLVTELTPTLNNLFLNIGLFI